MDKINNEIK